MRVEVLAAGYFTEANNKGIVSRWLVKVGDRVVRHAPIVEVETDKANLEVLAPDAGVVEALLVKQGDTIDRTTVLARIVTSSQKIDPPSASAAKRLPTVPRVDPKTRCSFCRTLRVEGRIDCARCGAPY